MSTVERRAPARSRRVFAFVLVTVAVTVASGAAAVAWWVHRWSQIPPLARDWTATVQVLAGVGVVGSVDGEAGRARFADPFGVAVSADGALVVADGGERPSIRRVAADGQVTTLAGGRPGFADGAATSARFESPSGVATGIDGSIYAADTGNNAIRRLAPDGAVTTLAGDGVAGRRDGDGATARFNGPIGIAIDATGRLVVADTYNDAIRIVSSSGDVGTLAGGIGPGFVDGAAADASFDTPTGVAVDGAGLVYVADAGNGAIRRIDRSGHVSTIRSPAEGDFDQPVGIAATTAGLLYVAYGRGVIAEIDPASGHTRRVAGSTPGFADGLGAEARFRQPAGIAVAGPGRLVVADAGNALLRLVVATSAAEPRLPPPPGIQPRFDAETFARQPLLWPVEPMDGPHEIAGTLGEARGLEAERFHAGIDVRKEANTPVVAVRDGVITHPVSTGELGSLNEWLRIGPLSYVHMRVGRLAPGVVIDRARFVPNYDEAGTLRRMRVKRGARFRAGEIVGSVNHFNHVHLNVGWSGDEYNPLTFDLVGFHDTVPPSIARGGITVVDELGERITERRRGRLIVSGRVRVVVDAWDQADGNRPNRRLGVYDLGYQVLDRDGRSAPGFDGVRETQRFDRLARERDAPRLVFDRGSGIPFFGHRRTRFLYVVTNRFRDGVATEELWDTTLLAPGDYILRVQVGDFHGNVARANRDLPVTVRQPAE